MGEAVESDKSTKGSMKSKKRRKKNECRDYQRTEQRKRNQPRNIKGRIREFGGELEGFGVQETKE